MKRYEQQEYKFIFEVNSEIGGGYRKISDTLGLFQYFPMQSVNDYLVQSMGSIPTHNSVYNGGLFDGIHNSEQCALSDDKASIARSFVVDAAQVLNFY